MQHRIKIVGTAEIDSPLDDKNDYSIALKRCAVKSTNRNSNTDDGEYCYTYSLESLDEITIIGAGATVIRGKAKSRSKQLRARLFSLAVEQGAEPETFYQEKMNYIISQLDDILKI